MMDIKYGIHGKYKTDKGIELQSTFYIGFWLGHVRQVYDVRIYPRKKANNIRYIDDIEEWQHGYRYRDTRCPTLSRWKL